MRTYTRRSTEERFWSFVDKTTDCWLWTGSRTAEGYATFCITTDTNQRHRVVVHRLAYELLIGKIPTGLVLDHLCRNPRCVNPAHLEPVTMRENVLRGVGPSAQNARKTDCPAGHPYDKDNTAVNAKTGKRSCRTCHRAHQLAYIARKAAS